MAELVQKNKTRAQDQENCGVCVRSLSEELQPDVP